MHSSEEAAYVEFVDAGRATLHAYAWLLTADAHAAEDLLQETLVRVYVKWRRVAAGQPLAYARRVMSNLHTDRWRKERRETVTDEVPDTRRGGRSSVRRSPASTPMGTGRSISPSASRRPSPDRSRLGIPADAAPPRRPVSAWWRPT